MVRRYTQQQVQLMQALRKLWEQHVYWTRFFIVSTAAGLGDLEAVTKRLLRNPEDFAAALTPFYGDQVAAQFKDLLTQHLMIAADVVNAMKSHETEKQDEARKKWFANADEIAAFLAGINPNWSQEQWKKLLYEHLDMTEREAQLYLGGKYAESIDLFEYIEYEALRMADYMAEGMILQFGL